MVLQFQRNITIYGSQLDHVWCNATDSQCFSITTKAWLDYKPIYFAYKLSNRVTNFISN